MPCILIPRRKIAASHRGYFGKEVAALARVTVRDRVAALADSQKQQICQMARDGHSIVEIADRFKLDYGVVQALLWAQGTLPWQGSKAIITRRLRSLMGARRQERRGQLIKEIQQQVDYLYYAARQLQAQLDRAKRAMA